ARKARVFSISAAAGTSKAKRAGNLSAARAVCAGFVSNCDPLPFWIFAEDAPSDAEIRSAGLSVSRGKLRAGGHVSWDRRQYRKPQQRTRAGSARAPRIRADR